MSSYPVGPVRPVEQAPHSAVTTRFRPSNAADTAVGWCVNYMYEMPFTSGI